MSDEDEWRAYAEEKAARLAVLRLRARKLRLTIKSSGRSLYYDLRPLDAPKIDKGFLGVPLCDLEELEKYIDRIATELNGEKKPCLDAVVDAIKSARKKIVQEKNDAYDAIKGKVCEFCEQPPDGLQEYKVGAEEANDWVHARCSDAFRERNRKRYEEMWGAESIHVLSGDKR